MSNDQKPPEKINPIAYDFYYGKILDSFCEQIANRGDDQYFLPTDNILENIDRITRKILTLKGC